MDIAVLGITPVGCAVAGLLRRAGHDVTIVGPAHKAEIIAGAGITVRQSWDGSVINESVKAVETLDHAPEMLVIATRMQDTRAACAKAAPMVGDAVIAAVQYGTKQEQQAEFELPRDNIVTCVLTLGATCYSPGDVTLNFKGHMVVGPAYAASDEKVEKVLSVMSTAFLASKARKIAHFNCTRLLLNLPYCVPAIMGENVQVAFADPEISAVAVLLLKEGVKIIEDAGVHIEPLPDFDESSLKALVSAPLDEAALMFGLTVLTLSRNPCQGPILGSIEQGEPSEIDFQNGELVKIAGVVGHEAPLNALMVELVHTVEKSGKFLSKTELLRRVEEAMGEG